MTERLADLRANGSGKGYVFHSPSRGPESLWDASNAGGAVAEILRETGYGWATPHVFRRTTATLLHESGRPLVRISDQLGHADPSMTASVYLGREHEQGDHANAKAL